MLRGRNAFGRQRRHAGQHDKHDRQRRRQEDLALRIEAVTVCVDYADFLLHTIGTMRPAVDDLVVVTSPDDQRTRRLCADQRVRTVVTTAMYDHGRKFSLGAAINAGLRDLRLDDWVLVIDADIALPAGTRKTLQSLILNAQKLYGIDRVHCRDAETCADS